MWSPELTGENLVLSLLSVISNISYKHQDEF
jgi:hypothetical protein